MDIDIAAQNKQELDAIAETIQHTRNLTDMIQKQHARIQELEAQLKQIRGVMRTINRESFDALGIGADLNRKP